eukprot:5093476-Alexandrium_andersonii.AAC.1
MRARPRFSNRAVPGQPGKAGRGRFRPGRAEVFFPAHPLEPALERPGLKMRQCNIDPMMHVRAPRFSDPGRAGLLAA